VNHLFLTGFMGAGKSTVGRLVAELLGRAFIDLDVLIEGREGMSVPSLFAERGEEGFRAAEHAALESLAGLPAAVVATGGGIVLRGDNRASLKRMGTVVYLSVSPESALARLGDAPDRPLLSGKGIAAAREVLGARLSLYTSTADHVVDTEGKVADAVAGEVAAIVTRPERDVRVLHVGSEHPGGYDVLVGEGLLADLGASVAHATRARSVVLVTDANVAALVGSRAADALGAADIRVVEHVIPAGESSKSWLLAGELLEAMAADGLDRGSAVVALGGGVVGDLAGFCASAYMRGIALVQVPTTLLAQVDSAIGGKTAVDLTGGKNLAGAFWPPSLVISDVQVLQSLPPDEWTNGLVEAVKHALLVGPDALERFEARVDGLLAREPRTLLDAVAEAAAFKVGIVTEDVRESGLRECLNLGHTLGHALEVLAGYGSLPHGLAVAEGMRFASRLAEALGSPEPGLAARTAALLARIGAPADHEVLAGVRSTVGAEAVRAAMKADKKSREGVVRFVLLDAPGVWRVAGIDDAVLLDMLRAWSAEGGGC
jgi:3-dehydroquinate synthase